MAKIRQSKRQSAWEYMRRNRVFRVEDVMIITQISKQNIRLLLTQLTKAKIITQTQRKQALEDKVFRVIDANSIICPVKSYKKKERV